MIAAIYARKSTALTLGLLAVLMAPASWAGQGWYLLVPYIVQDGKGGWTPSDRAALTDWRHEGSFDSAARCEARRDEMFGEAVRHIQALPDKRTEVQEQMYAGMFARTLARCIATDDPRLQLSGKR